MVVLFDRFNLPEDVYDIIFATKQQKIVGKCLIKYLMEHKGVVTKPEMSKFATELHDGEFQTQIDEEPYKGKKVKISYNKRQFYDRILTPLKSMGIIEYDLYKKVYKLSNKFAADLEKIGNMWIAELEKAKIDG